MKPLRFSHCSVLRTETVYGRTLRSTNKGGNGIAKDSAHQGLGDAKRRRIRGQAANALITSFMLCAENLRLIGSWAQKASPDKNDVVRLGYSDRPARNNDGTAVEIEPVAVSPPPAKPD